MSRGKTTPSYSTSSTTIRAVKGVIGSYRSASSTAAGASRSGSARRAAHCSGAPRQQPQRVRELRLRRVDAADQHVEDEVDQLDVGEPVALLLGRDQLRDQVVAGRAAAQLQQLAGVGVELLDGPLDPRPLAHQHRRVELALDPVRPLVQARRVGERRAHHGRDRQRRVRLRERLDEVERLAPPPAARRAAARGSSRIARPPALDRARREGRVDEARAAVCAGRRSDAGCCAASPPAARPPRSGRSPRSSCRGTRRRGCAGRSSAASRSSTT